MRPMPDIRRRSLATKYRPNTLPNGARIMVVGDSVTQYNFGGLSFGTPGVYYSVSSSVNGPWVQALLDNPRWNFDVWPVSTDLCGGNGRAWNGAEFGVAGITSEGMANSSSGPTVVRMTWEPMLNYDAVVMALGGNDSLEPEYTPATLRIMDRLRTHNPMIILCSIWPQLDPAISGGRLHTPEADTFYAYSAMRGCQFFDLSAGVVPRNTFNLPPYSKDGEHPSALGAWTLSLAINTFINTIVQPGNVLLNDYWNNVGTTNLAPDPTFAASGGTAGTGFSGSVPSGWTASVTTGTAVSTAVGSLVTNSDTGGNLFQIVVTPVIETVNELVVITPTTAITITANTWVTAFAEIDLPQGSGLYYYGTVTLADNATNPITNAAPFDCGAIANVSASTRKVWVKVPPFRTGANATTLTLKINLQINTSAAVNVTTNAAQSYTNVATIPVATSGIQNGMVCSGSGISGSPVVINDIPTPTVGAPVSGYVVLSSNQTLGNSLALTFTNPTTAMTWKVRRVWVGQCPNPQMLVNAAQT